MAGHFHSNMIPLQFCYQFYACMVVVALLSGISLLAMALLVLYGMGGAELIFTLSFICIYGVLRLVLPPWHETRVSLFGEDDGDIFNNHHYQLHNNNHRNNQRNNNHNKILAIDTYIWGVDVISNEKDIKEEDKAESSSCCTEPPKNDTVDKPSNTTNDMTCKLVATVPPPCCPICLHDFELKEPVSMGRVCRHVFHQDCLEMWLAKSTSCPYCRSDMEQQCTEKASGVQKQNTGAAWAFFDGAFDAVYA